ncbi:MAG: hypothetical protein RI554_02925 [Trueperaceae bacterium]|nr:hypothetical protein [Trueperaceae bacterium]
MRVGFVRSLLWHRYGPFWARLLAAADADVVDAEPDAVAAAWVDPRVAEVPGLAFRRAAAEALALSGADLLVVPSVNAGYEGARGGAQDPFVADLPGALAQILPGLPPLVAVPTDLDADAVETTAISLLGRVNPSAGLVRRAWQTHRADAHPPPAPGLPGPRDGARAAVGWVGQPWHHAPTDARVAPGVRTEAGERVLAMYALPPAELRAEGWRVDPKLAPSDAEVLGAVRRLARRPDVARFVVEVDPTSGADAWLARKVRSLARRDVEEVAVTDRFTPEAAAAEAGAVEAEG